MAKKVKRDKQQKLSALQTAEDKRAKRSVNTRLKEVLKKESKAESGAAHEYGSVAVVKPLKRDIKRGTSKPKLAIIIDDVSIKSHVDAVKSLGIPLTMSFLPPSRARPNSAKLASHEKIYMVHLPMEARNFNAEEDLTLSDGGDIPPQKTRRS